jgi:ubiquinone/menaquinone biosynthesis C-methylase UbiE
MTALKVILVVLGVIFLWYVSFRLSRKFYHTPAPAYIGRFLDSKLRRWLQSPAKIIERSGIRPGMTVLELGCGSGAFTTHIARAVGDSGKVYAVDIQPAMLRQLERKLSRTENQDIKNVEIKKASAYTLPFKEESIDLVGIITVLQEIPDRSRALQEVKRVLKAGGILAITEFLPDPDYPLPSSTIRLGLQEELILDGNTGNLWHYTVRFRKSPTA